MISSWRGTANVRAVLSGLAAIALLGAAQVSNAANVVRVGVTKIEFKWSAASGSPDGYLVSRSNKGGPLQAFAWVSEPRVEMPVAPGDQIAISVAAGARNTSGVLALGPASVQSDRIWVVAAPLLPLGGEWLVRCATCPSIAQRSLADASVVLAEAPALPSSWKVLGRAMVEEESDYLIWYNEATGKLVGWDPYDLVPVPGVVGLINPLPLRRVGPADFNGDGIEELLAQRTDTGDVVVIGLTSVGLAQVAMLPAPAGSQLVAARDFTGDGTIDFIWRNYADRTLTLQTVPQDPRGVPISRVYATPRTITTLPGHVTVESSGDYDGDGSLDILMRSADRFQILYLAAGRLVRIAGLGYVANDLSRIVVGSSDVDGIPGEEIALQNNTTSEMTLLFPTKAASAQRTTWLHLGPEWKALGWDS